MEMSMKELLLELDRNHLDVFQYDDEDDHTCYVDWKMILESSCSCLKNPFRQRGWNF